MKQMHISHSSSFILMLALLIGPSPMVAHEQSSAAQDAEKIAINLSEMELQEIFNNPKSSYIYVGKDISSIADVIEEISQLDDNKSSIVWGLRNHIERGFVVGNADAIKETLAYAEDFLAQQADRISQDQLDKINDSLDTIAHQIADGDLTIRKCDSCNFEDDKRQNDCFLVPPCCKGPRGPRGHRGRPGATGATGAAGGDVTGANVGAGTGLIFRDKTGMFINFKSLIQGSYFVITNNADDITLAVNGTNLNIPNTLVARDNTGSFAAEVISMVDGVVSQNIIFETEPSTPTAGNVIKGTSRFIHDFGIANTFVGINAGNFSMTGALNSGFGNSALTAITTGNNNTAVGTNALAANTTGSNNTATGTGALAVNTTGTNNTAVGTGALTANTIGQRNTAIGTNTLTSNTIGLSNTAVGYDALFTNVQGQSNTAVGRNTLRLNVASSNTAVGDNALATNTTGSRNTAVGVVALENNTIGRFNTAVGDNALNSLQDDDDNVAVGASALLFATTGRQNTAVGTSAMQNMNGGSFNTAVGAICMVDNITGSNNVAVGFGVFSNGEENVMIGSSSGALSQETVGVGFGCLVNNVSERNVALGWRAMAVPTTGANDNVAVGHQALRFSKGNFNVGIGKDAGLASTLNTSNNNIYISNLGADESNTIRIGNTHTACYIQGIYNQTYGGTNAPVIVDNTGKLGTMASTRRVKHNIADMNDQSADILNLRPVTFAYNHDATETTQYGLIAEEVDQIFPGIVVYDADGQPQTVQYHVLPVLLLNELKKQKVEFASAMEMINNRLKALEGRV